MTISYAKTLQFRKLLRNWETLYKYLAVTDVHNVEELTELYEYESTTRRRRSFLDKIGTKRNALRAERDREALKESIKRIKK